MVGNITGYFDTLQAQIHTSAVSNLRYGWWAYALGERTTSRFNENSKIISIDGNLASGKGALAQKLADKMGKTISGSLVFFKQTHTHTHTHTLNFFGMYWNIIFSILFFIIPIS